MCGIGGFVNIREDFTRLRLTLALGLGIDTRGGHASGFVAIREQQTHASKVVGGWTTAPNEFLLEAAHSDLCLMHSRWATCGNANSIKHAHPFAIKREGQIVLWGVHNGIIWNAEESASIHDRKYEVDSKELFELIADQEWETLRLLTGYGVAMWLEADKNHINLLRLNDQSDFHAVKVKSGGFVWGSTEEIVEDALKSAGLKSSTQYECEDVGRVYQISKAGIKASNLMDLRVLDPWECVESVSSEEEETTKSKKHRRRLFR